MSTAKPDPRARGFAVWVTGLPASGKSTLARAIAGQLEKRGVAVEILESDDLRRVLSLGYDDAGRDVFYEAMLWIGRRLVSHGIPVIFDATANRRAYRDRARAAIEPFMEVYVDCPLEVCVGRDPKGIYKRGTQGEAPSVPGLGAEYEPPLEPEIVVGGNADADESARSAVQELVSRGYVY